MPAITFLPGNQSIEVSEGITVLEAIQKAGLSIDSPCGGHGKCGKCRIRPAGQESDTLACRTIIERDMTVSISGAPSNTHILTDGISVNTRLDPIKPGSILAAVDIGTTTMVCYLLDGKTGELISSASMLNPQYPFGSDVISRIQAAKNGNFTSLVSSLRTGVAELIQSACKSADQTVCPDVISTICFVGNPTMQQFFLGLPVDNLASPPFQRLLEHAQAQCAEELLPLCAQAELVTLPDIAGYVGGDTMGCILSTRMYEQMPLTLLLDIGTNGEMVIGNRDRLAATSTAAGPALEGAGITFGMRGAKGAIDHVSLTEEGGFACHVIGDVTPQGICGSGLIDAVAAMLELGLINKRGRIERGYEELQGNRVVRLTEEIYLSQEDIRAVQMAKGAIAAGIELLCAHLGKAPGDLERVYLAGAFGSYISPASACRIGLIPPVLLDKISAVGNAAGSGARLCAMNRTELTLTDKLVRKTDAVELSALSAFQRTFAKQMLFPAF
ncbi:MAG: DUF4445 domain-containing protein [Blautia sp.]|nr:DUF4445 domain-containing protein [Blautia sp.]